MELNDIFHTVHDKIMKIKQDRLKPGAIVVSSKIYHEIASGYYSERRNGMTYPFFPDFSSMSEPHFDKLFGIPISVIQTSDKEFIGVYAK